MPGRSRPTRSARLLLEAGMPLDQFTFAELRVKRFAKGCHVVPCFFGKAKKRPDALAGGLPLIR